VCLSRKGVSTTLHRLLIYMLFILSFFLSLRLSFFLSSLLSSFHSFFIFFSISFLSCSSLYLLSVYCLILFLYLSASSSLLPFNKHIKYCVHVWCKIRSCHDRRFQRRNQIRVFQEWPSKLYLFNRKLICP
jgi:hypothetical protein